MKILALQGSPRPAGYTQMVLDPFLEGARSRGGETETILLAKQKIRPCIGCYTRWYKTPGICIHKNDDMPALLEKLKDCDVAVYATPLYYFSMISYMKVFSERMMPLILPQLVELNGETGHPHRDPDAGPDRIVLLSVCGFPEISHFDALVAPFRLLTRYGKPSLAGVLPRPGSESMLFMDKLGKKGKAVMEGFFRAGREIVDLERVSPETEAVCSQPWTTNLRSFRDQANLYWDIRTEHHERTRRGEETRPFEEAVRKDIRMLLGGMAGRFSPEFRELKAKLQFDVTGEQPGQWRLVMTDGYCGFCTGPADRPDLIIRTPSEVWIAIMEGRLNGADAFAEGKYTAEGDLNLLMGPQKLFGAA